MNRERTDRGSTWEDEEVFLLIDIWADEKIQHQLDSCSRKKPIFEKMAKRLEEEGGFTRSCNQIREKIKQLKQRYKKIKDNNQLSGRSRKTFKFFDKLDEVLGDRPITRPPSVFESGEQSDDGEKSEERSPQFNEDEAEYDTDDNSLESTSPSPSSSSANFSASSVNPFADLQTSQSSASPQLLETSKPSETSYETPKPSAKNSQNKVLSTRRGKSKKRSRNEAFLSDVCNLIQKQQERADELFFKREEERQQREMETEAKRRREEREHEVLMMQMMGNMFTQMAASFNSFAAPMQNNLPPNAYAHGYSTKPNQMFHQNQQGTYNQRDQQNTETHESDNFYTNLLANN